MEKLHKAKDTGFAIIFICVLVGLVTKHSAWFYAAAVATLLAMVWIRPFIWMSKVWFGLSVVLGFIGTRVLLGSIFFLILTPIAILHRKSHKNPLKLNNEKDSLFIPKNTRYEKKHLMSPF